VIVMVAAGGTAIAIAATGNGSVPPPKPLANAAHDALAGPAPEGVTARITFTNHLISSSGIEGTHADPLLMGATGRLWLTKGHFRIELQSGRGDAQVVADDKRFWVYDPRSNTVYRGDVPPEWSADQSGKDAHDVPSLEQVKRFISRVMEHAAVSDATPANVAGQEAYDVRVSPKSNGGLIGAGELAWDALNGVPLRIGVFAKGGSSPVLELKATDVSFGPVPASSFDVSPPPDAKVVEVNTASQQQGGADHGEQAPVTGVQSVDKAVPFALSAPPAVSGLARHEVRLLHADHGGAALVTYGRDLGGIAVLEQASDPAKPIPAPNSGGEHGDHGGLGLPTVSIDGVQAEELATPLGTVVRFERGGVAYTVIGSVPPATAEAAARGL
jgi:outer membrane lipoprotein-sorting protein